MLVTSSSLRAVVGRREVIGSKTEPGELALYGFLTFMTDSQRLGGKSALLVFILVLVAFVVESQLTQVSPTQRFGSVTHNLIPRQYVQGTLKYRQPYFLMYVIASPVGAIS